MHHPTQSLFALAVLVPAALCVCTAVTHAAGHAATHPTGQVLGQSITEDRKLVASDATADDWFGVSAAVSGGTGIVGAVRDDDAGDFTGSAYLFDTATGQQLFKLTGSAPEADDRFGEAVAIAGTTALVGAPGEDGLTGAVYVFDITTGQQRFRLTASDAAPSDLFGGSVAISGSTAVVGAVRNGDAGDFTGSAYVFDTTTGQQLFKLTASDIAAGDRFGSAVAVSGTTAIIGSERDDDAGDDAGAAYVFDTTTGAQLVKLTASDAAADDMFGASVAISGTLAIVGSRDDGNRGAAYVFDTTTGQQLFKLTASDGAAGDGFGVALGLSGTTAIVGAWQDDDGGPNAGSAYVFDTITGAQRFKLAASDATGFDQFGVAVAISGTAAIVGALFDDDAGNNAGSAYVFELPAVCVADFDGDGAVNILDVLGFISVWNGAGPGADFNGDGGVNILDVLAFLSVWNAGCP